MSDIPGFACTDCGKCCLEGAGRLPACERDIAMWQEHAPHVLEYVKIEGAGGQRTGEMGKANISTRCQWIKKFPGREQYYCRIYQWRPQVCRNYPTSLKHARLTDCPGVD
ncbi:MAG: YkgJ family cysteine cluster protein [Rhodospirillales bacterium]|nr:YkgJ family cysteine cluster protein [Rhodospirillales bacterium]